MTTKDQVAQIIVAEAKSRSHSRDECLAEMSCLYQESEWNETVWDPTRTTFGVAQQDGSYPNRFNGAAAQISAFFDRLDIKRTAPGRGDIWLNLCWLQQAPNWPSAQYWYDHGRRAYLTEIKSRIAIVTPYLDKYWPTGGTVASSADRNRPDFNEFPKWCDNSHSRAATDVDLWLMHTQEGGGGDAAAEDLANFLISTEGGLNPVSYHYTGSQASDGGVTIVDVVDTDLASWSVGNSNDRSINFCFAGSRASWTRDQWLRQRGVIEAAAYLFVQDCAKYPNLRARVIAPNYSDPPGAADHNYCTAFLKDGNNHTDVGPNFPWDVFAAAVAKYAGEQPQPQPQPEPSAAPDLAQELWDQLCGRWEMLGWQTVVETLAQLRDKLTGTADAGKRGFRAK